MNPPVGGSRRPVALILLGALWTLPNTVAGLLAGVAGMVFGAHAHWRERELALVFHGWPWGPGGALTLGNVILHTGNTLDGACHTYAHRADLLVDRQLHGNKPIVRADVATTAPATATSPDRSWHSGRQRVRTGCGR